MNTEVIILSLDDKGTIYALQDQKGRVIGTGTREVCEVLLKIATKRAAMTVSADLRTGNSVRGNVRAAIKI